MCNAPCSFTEKFALFNTETKTAKTLITHDRDECMCNFKHNARIKRSMSNLVTKNNHLRATFISSNGRQSYKFIAIQKRFNMGSLSDFRHNNLSGVWRAPLDSWHSPASSCPLFVAWNRTHTTLPRELWSTITTLFSSVLCVRIAHITRLM